MDEFLRTCCESCEVFVMVPGDEGFVNDGEIH